MNQKIYNHLAKDKKLKVALDKIKELEAPRSSGDVYYDLVRTIAFQQLSGKAATTIFNRFLELFEDVYPHPTQVLDFEIADLRGVGFSRQKSSYIQNIAQFFLDNDAVEEFCKKESDEVITEYLTQIKGVGVWTVHMLLMFTLERPDVFPDGDLGIQQGMIGLYNIKADNKKELLKKMNKLAAPWKPYRTYASRFIWRWKDS